ncbi:integral membrane protein, putative [Beauveria bassiana ARSEF 2860]|uniref:Integral membrane protein, putative n=1 Tax=Beauveria bassiana (strain ARSEF 2860) TaxID=655819 RepID=J5JM94_BEAB2|nr:integral membrane protein, putative [Beauveria bassiana ARSEF 2860]EJP64211.1 integral membrane protein, putative [Beauveria bassiana ARSEF 2860]
MTLYSDPPSLLPFRHDKPTLLVCWWMTSFCAVMICLRVAGRFIRTERLFLEDKIAALAIIPLALRMACVHYILLHGTNNADFTGVILSTQQLHKKSIASGLVLLSRFFYAATLWVLKCAILEFLRRITGITWQRSYQTTMVALRWTLLATFIAVVISDLAECRPFHHYWQVLPDPGGQCRQGYVQLLTMATCNVLTDLLLVIFPIPIILHSHMQLKRKIQLVLLFSLSLSIVCVTLYRVPHIIWNDGRQQYRSLLASVEILFATASANALVLGSFVRDRGLKKQKFRRNSAADSFDRGSAPRRPALHQHWGSDEDLVRDVGLAVDPKLRETPNRAIVAKPADFKGDWARHNGTLSGEAASDDAILPDDRLSKTDSHQGGKKMTFFDVGGLLDGSVGTSSGSYRRDSHTSSTIGPGSSHGVPANAVPASSTGLRRGSTALLSDLGVLFSPLNNRSARSGRPISNTGTELQPIPQSAYELQDHPRKQPEPL